MAAMQANSKFKRTIPIENIPVPERKKKVLSVQKVRGGGGVILPSTIFDILMNIKMIR